MRQLISLKKYLDSAHSGSTESSPSSEQGLFPVAMDAYCSALEQMGRSSVDACPVQGEELKQNLNGVEEKLSATLSSETVVNSKKEVQEHLRNWGRKTARHYQQKTEEVKDILLALARTAETVGERDQRCAQQITTVTTRLKAIANLEDLTEIRASIEQSASELKTSVDRMATEGKAAIKQLRAEVADYQAKLEEAELIASRDTLTGVSSRLYAEGQIERAMQAGLPFCVAMIDIDGFKQVNDKHGHVIGDVLLRQFAAELQSACRSTDLIGRWGGDEFLVLFEGGIEEAQAQAERLEKWVCGNYTVESESGGKKLRIDASFGLAEYISGETLQGLVERADAEMYQHKAAARISRAAAERSEPASAQ